MPFTGDDYIPSDQESLYEVLLTAVESELSNPATNSGDVLNTLLEAQAELAQRQEQSLAELHDAAYIATAEGEALELAAQDIGVTRKPAVGATGVARLSHGGPVDATYTAASGTAITTSGSDPIEFETTETGIMPLLDDFESGGLDVDWTGDTSSVSVVQTTVYEGTYALELPATSGVEVIHDGTNTLRQGHTLYGYYQPSTGTSTQLRFFHQSSSDSYFVRIDESAGSIELGIDDGGTETVLDSVSVTVPTAWLEVRIETSVDGTLDVDVVKDSDGSTVASLATVDTTFTDGNIALRSEDDTAPKHVDWLTTSAVMVNIEATTGGIDSNVGPNRVTSFVNRPTGFISVSNPFATGDPSITNTDGDPLISGRNEETDPELTERALNSTSIGGAATVNALRDAIRSVEGTESVTFFVNNSDADNTGSGGLPPWSVEPVVFGGEVAAIAEAIFDTIGVTNNTVGGYNGSKESAFITSSVLASDGDTINFSRPTEVNIDLTFTIWTTDEFVGTETVKNRIVEYIGGVKATGESVDGRDVNEDVYIEELRSHIIDVTGVRDIENFSSTPSQTTDANGIEIIDIGAAEIPRTDATDTSIDITVKNL